MSSSLDGLLSPSDVAELAGVKRPAVSNWRKRHEDFPGPVAGTEANPLFERAAVIAWLRQRGHEIAPEGPGSRLWSVLNSIRDRIPLEEVSNLVLLIAAFRLADQSEFENFARSHASNQAVMLDQVTNRLRRLPDLGGLQDPSHVTLQDPEITGPVVEAVAGLDESDIPEAVDFVLERLARWQIKGGAESGFVGSRTSALLASLAMQTSGTVYDPACGMANVLLRVADHGRASRLVGSDIDASALVVAAQRALLRNVDLELLAGDALSEDLHPGLHADVVVAEPPFGMSWDSSVNLADPRFEFGVPRKSADLAWVQHAIAHLNPDGGRAYVLTSPGVISRSGPERKIRTNLLIAGCVETIVSLPSKMLPHTSIAPTLWVLRPKNELGDHVLLIDATNAETVEEQIASWLLPTGAANAAVDAPHAVVPINKLLAADAILTPAKWIGQLAVDSGSIAESFASSAGAITRGREKIASSSLNVEQLAHLPESRIVTVQGLIDMGVLDLGAGRRYKVELRTGRSDIGRHPDSVSPSRIVRPAEVERRQLPPPEGAQADGRDATQAGDVLVTTTNGVHAVVDETGGHLISTGVHRLRIVSSSVLTPDYLAAVIAGSWNERPQAGNTIPRNPIRDLEIPLIPEPDQRKIMSAHRDVSLLREQAEQLGARAREMQTALLDALRYSVPLELRRSLH